MLPETDQSDTGDSAEPQEPDFAKTRFRDLDNRLYTVERVGEVIRISGPQMLVSGVTMRRSVLELRIDDWRRVNLDIEQGNVAPDRQAAVEISSGQDQP